MTAIPVCCDKAVYLSFFECPMHHPSPLGCDHLDKPYRKLLEERDRMCQALTLIATGPRPDGTYNRSREACEKLAREALESHDQA